MISNRTRKILVVAMADAPSANELINTIDELTNTVSELTTALNQLIVAYSALAAQLDTDSGVADNTYGTGAETPPTLVP